MTDTEIMIMIIQKIFTNPMIPVLVVLGCYLSGNVIKKILIIPDEIIPVITTVVGVLLTCVQVGFTVETVFIGAGIGWFTSGGYDLFHNIPKLFNNPTK